MRLIRGAAACLLFAGLPVLSVGCASLSPKLNVLPSVARNRAETQYQAARIAEQQGQYEKARELYASLQRQSPNTPEYAHRMGVACIQLQDYVTAGKYFEHARGLDPENPALLADMGYSAYLQKDYTGAEALLAESVRLNPDDARAVNNLALAIGFQGRYGDCLATFQRVNPETQALLNVAFVQSQRNDVETAKSTYQRVLSVEPGNKVASRALQTLTADHPTIQLAAVPEAEPAVAPADSSEPPPQITIRPAWELAETKVQAQVDQPALIPSELPPDRPLIASVDTSTAVDDDLAIPLITPDQGRWAPTHGAIPAAEPAAIAPAGIVPAMIAPAQIAPAQVVAAQIAAAEITPRQIAPAQIAPAGSAPTILASSGTPDTGTPSSANTDAEPVFELPLRVAGPQAELAQDPQDPAVPSAAPPASAAAPPSDAAPAPAAAADELADAFDGDDNAPEAETDDMQELAGLDWAQEQLAREKVEIQAGLKQSPRSDDCLRGYCPVALRDERRLAATVDEFRAEFQSQTFRFSSAAARDTFLEHPEWYVPVAGGLDVIDAKQGQAAVQGSLDFACWFRHRLHMFSSAEHLAAFRATPRAFAATR